MTTPRLALTKIENNEAWFQFLQQNNSNLLATSLCQMPFFGEWQQSVNRKVSHFYISKDTTPVLAFQIVSYPLTKNISYLYIPYGPLIFTKNIDKELLTFFKQEIKKILKKENAAFCRLDFMPPLDSHLCASTFFKVPLFAYKGAYFQPRVEWVLDISQSEDDIRARMHQKTRYSINLAQRKNLTVTLVEKDFNNYFETFYTLMKETALRDGFHLHDKSYYQKVFATGERDKNMTLVIVAYEGEVLVANLIVYYGTHAMYLYGSSSNLHRNRMGAHLAQWEAISRAKARGALDYNFGGIHTKEFPNKAWSGITYFKQHFGGYALVHSPFYDIVEMPLWYIMYIIRKLFMAFS